MRISDIVHKTFQQVEQMPRFCMTAKPKRQKFFLTPLTWLLSFPDVWAHKARINKYNMGGLKPPYLLLQNHNAFIDFKVTTAAVFPHRANYVVAIDGFINRENLLRNVGCICKRKFTNDVNLVKQIKQVLDNKDILVLYPEARYSHVGTTAILPESLGKMVKLLKVPIVTLICHGDHLSQPVWNLKKRNNPISADMTQIMTANDVANASVEEINEKINNAFVYDDYKWQKENKVRINLKTRAEGLHKVLYQCPCCLTEGEMATKGNTIFCQRCGKKYEMNEYGELHATEGKTEFCHIPDWYEWQRNNVRRQIEEGAYRFSDEVQIDSLPNSSGYYRLGKGTLTHDYNGFRLNGDFDCGENLLSKTPLENYSIHVEYSYFGKGDCISLSTINDTYYIYPQKQNVVTKLHFATEELYKYAKNKSNLSPNKPVLP